MLLTNGYEIFGISKAEKNKGRCGDYYVYKVFNDELVVMALADGVGSMHCDWLASKTTCELFIQKIGEKVKDGFDPECIDQLCAEVDKYVSNPPEDCKGMMSTLVAVIWNVNESFLHFIDVGDSRIYKVSREDEICQISTDDKKPINMRDRQGKLMLSGGFTVVRTGLTNAFGLSNVKAYPQFCDFKGGDTIILASDGFYQCSPGFEKDIIEIAHSLDLEKSVKRVLNHYSDFQDDDSTVLILRNKNFRLEFPENIMDVDYLEIKGKMATFQITGILYEKLEHCIIHKHPEIALDTLTIMDDNNIIPSREMLDHLIALMKNENNPDTGILRGIVNLIKKDVTKELITGI